MKKSALPDPFAEARRTSGLGDMNDQDDPVKMLLRLKDVRRGAHNWRAFQSGAEPGRIVIPSEVAIRDVRQIPFETDPPDHTAYRALVEDWFRRPLEAAYRERMREMIAELLTEALAAPEIEVVADFALKLQSRALTLLLNVPEAEADVWIGWGTHVFRSEGVALDGDKASILYDYIDRQIERAVATPGEDLYSVLLASEIDGRKLTHEEVKGVMILTFAGGRDTVINAVTNTVAYFAEHPEGLEQLRNEPEITGRAVEELIRYFAPLTQMGRVVTEDTVVCEHAARAGSRVGLCWASANRDETVFERPEEIVLDRKMNPHLSFGFGVHNCLGATHARELMKLLLEELAARVGRIDILDHTDNVEDLDNFKRKVGFHRLAVNFVNQH